MKFLITGGAGFIGSHLSRYLLEQGHDLVVVDDLSTGTRENVAELESNSHFTFRLADDNSPAEQLADLAADTECVIHLAAAVGVQKVMDEPIATVETNVDYTQHVLRACMKGKQRLLIASTSEVYGRSEADLFRETDDLLIGPPTQARWGYAASKLVDEFLALAYYKEHRIPITILRLFNTVGPRQTGRYGMVIPRFIRQALSGEDLRVFGDGQQRRTFTCISQVVEVIDQLVGCEASIGEVVNIGGVAETSIGDLADEVIRLTESKSNKVLVPYDEAYGHHFEDMRRRNPCTEKLNSLLGWAPDRNLEEILTPIISYMKEHEFAD